MANSVRKKLKVVGEPGLAIEVQQRGSQDIEAVGESEVFFKGKLNQSGEALIDVPKGAMLVLFSNKPGGPLPIEVGHDDALQTVRLVR